MICHPTANFLGHYAFPGLAARGLAGIGLTTRYVGNDTSLNMENCLLDMGSMVAHLRSLGYEKVVLVGNSGGASIVPYYQAQAESPTVTTLRAAGPTSREAGLEPADAIAMLNAHSSQPRDLHRDARPGDHRRAPALRAGPAARHVQPQERPAFQRRVHRDVSGRPDRRNRRITSWAEAQLRVLQSSRTTPTSSTTSPSSCRERWPTSGCSMRRSIRATGWSARRHGAHHPRRTTCQLASGDAPPSAHGSTSGRSTTRLATRSAGCPRSGPVGSSSPDGRPAGAPGTRPQDVRRGLAVTNRAIFDFRGQPLLRGPA